MTCPIYTMAKCTIDYENRKCEWNVSGPTFNYVEYTDILRNIGDICEDVQEFLRTPNVYREMHNPDWCLLMTVLSWAGDEHDERLGNEQTEILRFIPDGPVWTDSSDDDDSDDPVWADDSSDDARDDDHYDYPEWVAKGYGDQDDEAEPTRYINISAYSPSYQYVRDRDTERERDEARLPPMYQWEPPIKYNDLIIQELGPVPAYSEVDYIQLLMAI